MKKKIGIAVIVFTFLFSFACFAYPNISVTNLSPLDAAFQEVCVISLKSSAMLINGAVRYIDDDNLKATPRLIDARTYITVKTAETLFNAYVEDKPQNAYVDFRREDTRLVLNGKSAEVNGISENNDYLIYIEGKAYMPLRKLSELLGKTVFYDDGYVVIGENEYVNNLVENTQYFNYGKSVLDSYNPVHEGKSLFVSPSGNDIRGKGTIEQPYKTIARASKFVQPGDTVYLREGIYRETISPDINGTPAQPITYKAYNGENAVINAAEVISGFAAENGNLISADCPIDLGDGRNQLFYNNEALTEARFPNVNKNDYSASDVSLLFPTKGDLKVEPSDVYTVTSTLLDEDFDNKWAGANFVSLHGSAWSIGTAKVASSTAGTLKLDPKSVTKTWWFSIKENESVNFGYLTGHRNAIDLPGEWVYENGKIIMLPPEGTNADNLTVEVKARQLCVDLKDKKYIQIDGIKTIGGGINLNGSEMCVVKNCDMRYISHYTLSKDQRENYIDDADIYNQNSAPQRGEMGIYVGGKNNVIRNNRIDTSAASALYLIGLYTLIENNDIINCGYMGSYASGIHIGSLAWEEYSAPRGGYIIKNNNVRNAARSVLSLQTTEIRWENYGNQVVFLPCEISYNCFSNGGICTLDTGNVYFWGATMGNEIRKTRFHHNTVYSDCITPQSLHSMIYHDNYMNMMETYNNLIFKTDENMNYVNSVYIQSEDIFPNSYAVIDAYDNIDYGLKPGGLSDISAEEYPGGIYFHTGIKH